VAASRRQVTQGPEGQHQADCGGHEQPVHGGHLDLPMRIGGSLRHRQAGQQIELHRLAGQ